MGHGCDSVFGRDSLSLDTEEGPRGPRVSWLGLSGSANSPHQRARGDAPYRCGNPFVGCFWDDPAASTLSKHVSSALHVLPLIFRASQLTKQQEEALCSLAEMYTRALFRRKVSPTQEVQNDQPLGSLVAQVHRHLASEPEDVHRWWAGFGGRP